MKKNYILLTLLFICNISFSQVIVSKVKYSAAVFPDTLFNENICVLKNKTKVKVLRYLGRDKWQIESEKCNGFVSGTIEWTTSMVAMIENYDSITKVEDNKKLKIKQKRDSIELEKYIKTEELKSLEENKRKDSLAKVWEKKIKLEKELSENKIKSYRVKYNGKNADECCKYMQNEKDEFNDKVRKHTNYFNLSGNVGYDGASIELVKFGNIKYVIFDAGQDLGCASSYSTRKSYVKVKLENGKIVTFYHFGDVDCKDPTRIYGKLTQNDIYNLKNSPVKSIRMNGTEYYQDFTDISFKNIFINKLDCIK